MVCLSGNARTDFMSFLSAAKPRLRSLSKNGISAPLRLCVRFFIGSEANTGKAVEKDFFLMTDTEILRFIYVILENFC